MFWIKRDKHAWWTDEGENGYRMSFDVTSVRCCLRALQVACPPASQQEAQELLHEAVECATLCSIRIPTRTVQGGLSRRAA